MPISWLFSGQPLFFVVWVVAIIITLTVHEFSHAAVANFFGDRTAKEMGRLSLNPLVHIDLVGFLMLLFIGFGWAKPVPVNPYNLRKQRLAMGLVSLAGPLSNLLGVIIFVLVYRLLLPSLGPQNLLIGFFFSLILVNLSLFVFNLIPIPPLDGSKVLFSLLSDKFADFKYKFETNGPWILLVLLVADSILNLGIFNWLFELMIKILYYFL